MRLASALALALTAGATAAGAATLGCNSDSTNPFAGGAISDVQYYATDVGAACGGALLAGRACPVVAAASPPPVLWVEQATQAGVSGSSLSNWALTLPPSGVINATAVSPVGQNFSVVVDFVAVGASSSYTVWSGPQGRSLSVANGQATLVANGQQVTQPLPSGVAAVRAGAVCTAGSCSLTID